MSIFYSPVREMPVSISNAVTRDVMKNIRIMLILAKCTIRYCINVWLV